MACNLRCGASRPPQRAACGAARRRSGCVARAAAHPPPPPPAAGSEDSSGCISGGSHPAATSRSGSSGRRAILVSSAAAALAAVPAARASVAPPQAPTLAGRISGALPLPLPIPIGGPQPVGFPRKTVDQRFAVLLMRSSYDAVDELDFVSMEKFQIQFWKYRQSEVESYALQYKPLTVRAGDLTDPIYFDFISYAQYATISRAMRAPQQVFEERYSCDELAADDDESCAETRTRVVRRPAAFGDDAALPELFFEAAGDRIYTGLVQGFRGEQFGGPPPARRGAPLAELMPGVRSVYKIFADRGYCLSAEVTAAPAPAGGDGEGGEGGEAGAASSSGGGGGSFEVRVTGPANLWGLGALASQAALVANAHDAMAVAAYLRASGRGSSRELELSDTGYTETWTVL
ncbi:hypothetical protein Rsub_03283 [Raphidocelis subcapitata]|uniref:Uncharacterized protein n=1 Tax=Raphidocelis subcapitata TaxID=307507 RepID=A0A2V0NX46_9CHLO|nr:hypothetical protein Rsub_03283 [Raphidocelis subcapitata]|eukprot:GBF90150.1 hypothetical protein Rsub_03283 [Raphidocelis subcapitata]